MRALTFSSHGCSTYTFVSHLSLCFVARAFRHKAPSCSELCFPRNLAPNSYPWLVPPPIPSCGQLKSEGLVQRKGKWLAPGLQWTTWHTNDKYAPRQIFALPEQTPFCSVLFRCLLNQLLKIRTFALCFTGEINQPDLMKSGIWFARNCVWRQRCYFAG